jgi:hypothetical protein
MLTPLEGRLSGDADYNYVYGVAALDSGHPAQAAVALRHALKLRPDFHLARAELGRALAAMGDYAGAKQEFELVRNVPDLPPVARDALGRQVTAIDAALTAPAAQGQPAGPRVNGYIESSVGYDTNVNSGPSNQTLVIPGLAFLTGGAPLTLLPAAMPKKSAFYELAGGLSVALPINNDWALFSNIAGNVHQLFTNQEFRSALAGGEVGVARQIQGLGTFSLAGIGQTFVLGGSTFRNIFGAAGQWRQRFADTWDASVAVSWLRMQYPNAIGNDTNRYTVTGIVAQRFETPMKPSISLAFNLGKEVAIPNAAVDPATNTAGSFNLMGARLGLEATFLPWLAGFFQTGYEVHQYTVFNQVFLDKRRDNLLDVLAGVEVKFTDNISVRPSVQFSRTESNFELFKTQRWIAQSALRWSF